MIDTSPQAVSKRASETIRSKHETQMELHIRLFGPLGQAQRPEQKKALKLALKKQKNDPTHNS